MAEVSTFIKLDRNILNWGWYTDLTTKAVFLHMLLKANIQDKMWLGKPVKRGQLVTSTNHLSAELSLSVQSVRTALSHLRDTGEITTKATTKFTIVTIVNFEKYQAINAYTNENSTNKSLANEHTKQPTANTQLTNNQQASNKQLTTTKEIKNKKNEKNEKNHKKGRSSKGLSVPSMTEVIDFCKIKKYTFDSRKFYLYYQSMGWMIKGQPIMDWKALAEKWQTTEKDPGVNRSYDIDFEESYSPFDDDESFNRLMNQ